MYGAESCEISKRFLDLTHLDGRTTLSVYDAN